VLQIDDDEKLFLGLLADLFPGVTPKASPADEIEAAIEHQVREAGLVNHPKWNAKLIQVR